MGISGLLPLLKSIHKPCNLKKFAGQTIGVDAYGWLHRGTVACAIDLALGKPTSKFVEFSMNRVRMLIHFGVTPYLVFDGDYLPSKALTEGERARKRDESRKLGLELHRLGKPSQAHLELQKAVDVTPEMARQLIEELKKLGVQYVVAPYEADAQLAYLERKGIIHGIISEDSDLLVFGAKCLLTKLDQYGDCVEINRSDFTACREISLVGWTDAEFRRMAILSGCDYLTNINKMGLKTAYRFVRKYRTIEKILRMLQFDGQYHVPTGYLEAFQKAELTFLHQRVFCPLLNDIVMTTSMEIDDEPKDFEFIGGAIDRSVALGIAKGDLHPMTKEPIIVKSTSGSVPSTPWGRTLKKSLSTSADLKANMSIDAFFKTKRTPLAELDPNSFTPSPSQQRLLQRSNGPWLSTPARAPPTLPRSSASMPPSTVPSSTGLLPASGTASSLSAPHSQKRRRLCVEPADAVQLPQTSAKGETQRSRFFTPSMQDPSPTLKKNGKSSGEGKDINIWSDDSVEDIMAGLPDVSDRPVVRKTGKLKIFNDEENGCKTDPPPKFRRDNGSASHDSQCSTSSNTTITTAATSFTDTTLACNKTFNDRVASKPAALCEKFSYQPALQNRPPQRNGEIHKVKLVEHQRLTPQDSSIDTSAPNIRDLTSSISIIQDGGGTVKPVVSDMVVSHQHLPEPRLPQRSANEHKVRPGEYQSLLQNKSGNHLVRQGSMTPLQRLGASALTKSQSCVASLGSSRSVFKKSTELTTENADRGLLTENPIVSKPLYNASLDLSSIKGSEDAMIPDSEAENEDVISGSELDEPEQQQPKLNLGRFAFSG